MPSVVLLALSSNCSHSFLSAALVNIQTATQGDDNQGHPLLEIKNNGEVAPVLSGFNYAPVLKLQVKYMQRLFSRQIKLQQTTVIIPYNENKRPDVPISKEKRQSSFRVTQSKIMHLQHLVHIHFFLPTQLCFACLDSNATETCLFSLQKGLLCLHTAYDAIAHIVCALLVDLSIHRIIWPRKQVPLLLVLC